LMARGDGRRAPATDVVACVGRQPNALGGTRYAAEVKSTAAPNNKLATHQFQFASLVGNHRRKLCNRGNLRPGEVIKRTTNQSATQRGFLGIVEKSTVGLKSVVSRKDDASRW
jgi:hypothetical protein